MTAEEVKDCTTCGRINYCANQYKGECPDSRDWIPRVAPQNIDSALRELIIVGIDKKLDKRTIVIEHYAENATIEELSYFTQLLERSKLLDQVLDILNQFSLLSARELSYLTGVDNTTIFRTLNKLFDLGMVTYEVTKGGEINAYKNVKKWKFNIP